MDGKQACELMVRTVDAAAWRTEAPRHTSLTWPVVCHCRSKLWSWTPTFTALVRAKSSSEPVSWPTWRRRETWRSPTSSSASRPVAEDIWPASKCCWMDPVENLFFYSLTYLLFIVIVIIVDDDNDDNNNDNDELFSSVSLDPSLGDSSSKRPWEWFSGTALPTLNSGTGNGGGCSPR